MRTREGDDFIEKMVAVMSDYRLLHTKEEGNEPVGYPLIDALTFDGGTVDIGEEECGELAAELYDSVIAPFILEAERRAEQRVRAEIGEDRILLPSYQAFCNSAKGLLSGEFMIRCPDTICPECEGTGWEDEDEDLKCGECDGNGTLKATTPVPWTTIKDIYRAITEEYGPKAAIDEARGRK